MCGFDLNQCPPFALNDAAYSETVDAEEALQNDALKSAKEALKQYTMGCAKKSRIAQSQNSRLNT